MFRTKIGFFRLLQANLFVNSAPVIKDNVMYITSSDDMNNSMLIQNLAFENQINHIVIEGDSLDNLPRLNYLFNITKIDILAQKINNIPENCFSFCKNLTSVQLHSGIVTINANAFYSTPISEINLDNVKEIHNFAFKCCPNLLELNLPAIQVIGKNATESSGIQTVKLGYSLVEVSDFAFFNCKQLVSIQFGKNLTKIGNGVFMLCQNLTQLNLEDTNLQSIGSYSFYGLNIKNIKFTNSINQIGAYSFAYSSISSLDFLVKLTDCEIDEYAFAYCNEIKSVIINSETNINDAVGMFYCCSNLENITLNGKDLDIPMNFAYCCSKLTNFDAKSIKQVEYKAFYMCFNLKSVNLHNCKLISIKSFSNCYNLNVTSWPYGPLYLGESCFAYCSSLDFKLIPSGYSVQQKAFIGCTSIKTLLIKSFRFDLQTRTGGHFVGCSNLVNVTFNTIDMYAIPCNCFYKCTALERITLPEGCTTILENAFAFTNLKEFDFTDINYICQSAFESSALSNVFFTEDITIDNFAFKNCKSLKK